MWPTLIVIDSPRFNLLSRVVRGHAHLLVQTSSRERPLKLSLSALSKGFPGRMKSSLMPLTPNRNLVVYTIALASPMPGPATSANSRMRLSSPRWAAKAGRIGATDLLPEISRSQTNAPASTLVFCTGYYERTQLLRALNQAGGNQTKAGNLLGMSRATLCRRFANRDIDILR